MSEIEKKELGEIETLAQQENSEAEAQEAGTHRTDTQNTEVKEQESVPEQEINPAQNSQPQGNQAEETVKTEEDIALEAQTNQKQKEELETSEKDPAYQSGEKEEAEQESKQQETQTKENYEKLFTLRYKIDLEDYFMFHKISGKQAVDKARKKTVILGWVELAVGVAFILFLPMKQGINPMFSMILAIMMLLMGGYGVTYYKYFYDRMLRRALKKQRARTPYLQNEIVIDFYPNKFIEYNEKKNFETFWHTIKEVRISETLFMVMLNDTRCLLVPKSSIPAEVERFDTFLQKICEDFEKPRVKI